MHFNRENQQTLFTLTAEVLSMEVPLVRLERGGACLDAVLTILAGPLACGSESHNIINPLNTLTQNDT